MSTNTKGRERPGTVFTLGVLLSTLGVAAVGLLCCGMPLLVIAGGALGAAGSVTGNPWMIAAAAGIAGVFIIRALRRGSAVAAPQALKMSQESPDRVPSSEEHATPHTDLVAARNLRCCA